MRKKKILQYYCSKCKKTFDREIYSDEFPPQYYFYSKKIKKTIPSICSKYDEEVRVSLVKNKI